MAEKLAREVVAAGESDEFDMGGYTAAQVDDFVKLAFSKPIPASGPLRFTFIVGGGKGSRQRYDDAAAKQLCTSLRALGFNDDAGASECLECQGAYKHQHDTGKNEKKVHIFPHVEVAGGGVGGAAAAGGDEEAEQAMTPIELCVAASLATFQAMAAAKVTSWTEKKTLLAQIKETQQRFEAVEAKLCSGATLSAEEDVFYSSLDSTLLASKVEWLAKAAKGMVAIKALTGAERGQLVRQMDEKLADLDAQAAALRPAVPAAGGGEGRGEGGDAPPVPPQHTAKLVSLEEAKTKLLAKQEGLKKAKTIEPPLKDGAELVRARQQLKRLLALEQQGKALSSAEVKMLIGKDRLVEQLDELEGAARGWFEDDASFEARVRAEAQTMSGGRRR
jgi:hypothetical protein